MFWRQISLVVPEDLKDALVGELTATGALGVWDDGEHLVAYFRDPVDTELVVNAVHDLFERSGLPLPSLSWESIRDQDWAEDWKKTWSTFPIGKRFFVIPSWSDPSCPADRIPIYLDPGQAFGTGTHETTQLTLEAMERWIEPGQAVLDIGTGSGILAIAAAWLGAGSVVGCDVDPVSVEVAAENCIRNDQGAIRLVCGSVESIESNTADLVLCNLTADVIGRILGDVDRILKAPAIAVFSGVLNSQSADLKEKLQQMGQTILQETSRGEWCVLVSRKDGR